MRTDAISLEEKRLTGVEDVEDYTSVHERHRIFPTLFEKRNHKKIIDLAAGVGVVGERIQNNYDSDLICNDISPTCLKTLQKLGLQTVSFDLDDDSKDFPFPDGTFDAVISLATIEHIIHIDHFLKEIGRILKSEGYLYLSAPNYSGLMYLIPFIFSGKTFHDPMSDETKYEFYAHVRYFTYRSLYELVTSFGFFLDTVYLAIPKSSSRYLELFNQSKKKAFVYKSIMTFMYKYFSPRWASEPVLCFKKSINKRIPKNIRKVVL